MRVAARGRLLGATLLLAACASPPNRPAAPPAGSAPAAPSAAPAASASPAGSASQGAGAAGPRATAPVVVTGVVVARGGGKLEICPDTAVGACAGIEVQGQVDPAFLSTAKKDVVVRVPGVFDGARLKVDGKITTADVQRSFNFNNRCPEFQQPAGGNPKEQLPAEVERLVQAQADRFAGRWWDQERKTMALWFTGDATALKREVQRIAPGARVCVLGNAKFSERALEAVRPRADAILAANDVLVSSSSLDTLGNRVVYTVEAIDPRTLDQLRREVGDAVRVVSFIELRDGSLATLPSAPRTGDIPLVTSRMRNEARMQALGRFSVHLDAERRCVYLQDAAGRRVLPVWPFGYSATREPFAILDFDGKVAARPGAVINFGGGQVELKQVQATETCGAQWAWIGAPEGR
ncbi:uncharacterized protein SOCE26_037680 [Sorangium cellulosum]|uniref:Lipoprotein n=1 Tax=Sorangium cellulosum TaxID=56 RepID=A0A2L0ESP2_SORCE|nr:hypothetical protein [Sorangium cellulosum]AUX42338.1 uncharacterized protein SOCE26_037680 [Sorangium cellulosum]